MARPHTDIRQSSAGERRRRRTGRGRVLDAANTLAGIHRFARDRMAAPYAVLGCVLRRAISLVEPRVKIPAVVGDTASANLFTVAVGRSGQGKDIANGVGRRAVVFVTPDDEVLDDPEAPGIGSGEEGWPGCSRGTGTATSSRGAACTRSSTRSAPLKLADRKGHTWSPSCSRRTWVSRSASNCQKATTTHIPADYRPAVPGHRGAARERRLLPEPREGRPSAAFPVAAHRRPLRTRALRRWGRTVRGAGQGRSRLLDTARRRRVLIDVPPSVKAVIRAHRLGAHRLRRRRPARRSRDADPAQGGVRAGAAGAQRHRRGRLAHRRSTARRVQTGPPRRGDDRPTPSEEHRTSTR